MRRTIGGRLAVLRTAVQVVLVLNALPAFILLTLFPGRTGDLFVWAVKPEASAQLLAAMYGNAGILALLSLGRRTWPDIRVTFVVFTLFSVAVTIVTFFHLDPFLAHPRYFFVYWLVNYLFLFVATPIVFWREEVAHGGRLAVRRPIARSARVAAATAATVLVFTGAGMLAGPEFMDGIWPWALTPVVARIAGVWFTALGAAFLWALRDGDAERTRPIFVQALPTALLVGIVPALHRPDLVSEAGPFVLFVVLVAALAFAGLSSRA
jgi:hypothetical protein